MSATASVDAAGIGPLDSAGPRSGLEGPDARILATGSAFFERYDPTRHAPLQHFAGAARAPAADRIALAR